MKLEKGMLVSPDNVWYVVINIRYNSNLGTFLECVCDHANNRYSWRVDEIKNYLSCEEISRISYGWPDRFFRNKDSESQLLKNRGLPFQVIAEVLLGGEDKRFSDYEDKA